MVVPLIGAHQGNLETVLKSILPIQNAIYNARKSISIKNPNTGKCMEVDVWYPDLDLGFEFQDEHHYKATNYAHSPLTYYQEKDTTKKTLLQERKVTLIVVPYWWDGTIESLTASINFQRPDLLSQKKNIFPIPLNPPSSDTFYVGNIPGVGELMLASFPISMDIFTDPQWWLGEKYDGVRCCWNPKKKQLYSRTGAPLPISPKFANLMCPIFIDAELWSGRGNYVESYHAIRSSFDSSYIRLIGFDVASYEHQLLTVEKRFSILLSFVPFSHPFIIVPIRMRVKYSKQITKILKQLIEQKSEGIILQKMKSQYLRGRSNSLWKLKAIQGDQEALITSVDDKMCITVQMPNGQEFTLDPPNYTLHRAPKKGDIVSLAVEDQSRRDSPTNPRAVRIREDLTWNDVLHSYSSEKKFEEQQKLQDFTTRPAGFWSRNKMRTVLENYAKEKERDPLIADSWYSLVAKEVLKSHKDVRAVINKYAGSLIKAVVDLFPEIQFDKKKFTFGPNKFYNEVANRRKLFENFAVERKIDPLLAKNWYSFGIKDFRNVKGVHALIWRYYGGNLGKALLHVFPNIGLDLSLFKDGNWFEKRRRIFLDFARNNGFDPLLPTNWYSVKMNDIMKQQGAHFLLQQHYDGKLSKALVYLFPDIGIDEIRFEDAKNLVAKRKKVFEMVANVNGFNPRIAENWHSVMSKKSASNQVHTIVQKYYKDNIADALRHLFPSLTNSSNPKR